ncbi:MAG: TOBE domain-containing protein, partial [Candidatus Binatia bacterium]
FAARRSVEWQPGMAAELFFRPESIELLDANGIDGLTNHGSARVERVTFLGNSADVILRSGAARLRLRAHPARIPSVGTTVNFSVAAESCIVFPA